MRVKKKTSPPQVKNVRIRFKDQDQLDLIKRAAKVHGKSLNAFVISVCEMAAEILVNTEPVDSSRVISRAVREALTER